MVQTLSAQEINLQILREKFSLELVENDKFFPELQYELPEISSA
ncbi:hypothetical protein [Hydrocoleum sp. CS-953]